MQRLMFVAALGLIATICLMFVLSADPLVALSRDATLLTSTPWQSGGPNGTDGQPIAINSLEASPNYRADGTLFAAADSGIYRSQDQGQSWQLVVTPPAPDTFSHVGLSPDFNGDGIAFAVRQQGGNAAALHRSADRGGTWQVASVFTETVVALRLSTDFPSDHTLFVLTGDGTTLQKSTDGGYNWTRLPISVANPPNGIDIGVLPGFATNQTLFVAGFGETVRSDDGGSTWTPVPNAGPNYSIAISPNFAVDRTLWQSFRSIESAGDGSPEADVIRSNDGGSTWFYSTAGLPGVYEPFPRHLAVSPHFAEDSTLFTALSGQFVAWQSYDLFCSYDGGSRWINLGSVPGNLDVTDLAVSDENGEATDGLTLHVATTAGVWQRTVDCRREANQAWLPDIRKNAMPLPTTTPSPTPTATSTATASPTPTATIQTPTGCYAGFNNGGFERDASWTIRPNPALAAYVTIPVHSGSRSIRTGIPAGEINVASYSPIQQEIFFPAGLASADLHFWRYSVWGDGGQNRASLPSHEQLPRFIEDMPGAVFADDFFYAIAILEDGTIDWLFTERADNPTWREKTLTLDVERYARHSVRFQFGTYNNGSGGISRTFVDDAALNFCPPAGALLLPGGWAERIFSQPTLSTLYAAVATTLYRSDDAGASWRLSGTARPEHTILSADPNRLYAGSGIVCAVGGPPSPFWRSVDGGASWQQMAGGSSLKPLAAHPTDPDRLYAAGCNGPYLSTDGGASFTHQPGDLFGLYEARFIAPAGSTWGDVWVGGISEGGGGAVIVSHDGGANWARSTPLEPEMGWFGDLKLDRFAAETIFAPAAFGFYYTTNNGIIWLNRSDGLADVLEPQPPMRSSGVHTLVQEPVAPYHLFLGTARGLYTLTPNNTAWTKLNGLPYDLDRVTDLDLLDAAPGMLYVTIGTNVYRLAIGATATATPTPTATRTSSPAFTPTPTATPTPSVTHTATPTATTPPTPVSHNWPMPYLLTQVPLASGARPHGVAVNEAGDRLYIALHGEDHTGRTLAVLDGPTWQMSGTVALAEAATGPNGVALLGTDGRVLVANRQTASTSVVDVASVISASQVISSIAANLLPNGVAVSGGYGYIANFGSDTVTVFDPMTLDVIRTLSDAGREPSHFAVDPTTGDVFVSAHGSNQVAQLHNGHVAQTYQEIPSPYGLAFDPVSRYLYIANRGKAHTVTILDTSTGNVIGAIPVILEPFVLTVNPDSGHLFVSFGDQVRVLRTRDWSLVTSFEVPAGAEEGIALHSGTDRVFVTSGTSDALTVLQDSWPAEIVYASAGTETELYTMLPDATRNTRLTNTPGKSESEPDGSPDGRWIAYVRREEGKGPEIWLMGRNGQNQQPLVQNFGELASPSWSPDGQGLVFASQNDGDWELYTVAVNTGVIARLTDNSADDLSPDWSWFTDRIVFVSNRIGPNPEVYSMLSDGNDVRRLSVNPNGDAIPHWSPNGLQIVFASTRESVQSLFVMKWDGSDIHQLVDASLRPSSPAWSPDGSVIAFSGYRPGNGHSELFRVTPDGTELHLLTNNELEFDFGPGWLPGK